MDYICCNNNNNMTLNSEDEGLDEFEMMAMGGPGCMSRRGGQDPVRYIGHNPFLDVSPSARQCTVSIIVNFSDP